MNHNESFTTEEIADILKVSKLTVYDLIKKGKIKAYRVGRQMRVDAADLETFKKNAKETLIDPLENDQAAAAQTTTNAAPAFYDPFANYRSIIISGQDSSLDILAKHFEAKGKAYRPLRSYIGSLNGLLAMYKGLADIVSTHLFDGDTNTYNIPYIKKLLVSHSFIVIRYINRQAGFYIESGNPKNIKGWNDLKRHDIKILNREIGSGARILLDEQLRLHQIKKKDVIGYNQECMSHYSVAAGISQGKADIGIGIEKTSYTAGVDFIPLITENYDLVILKSEKNKELIQMIKEIIESEELKSELKAVGYDVEETGKIVFEQ
ncbi:substrate-binding domain-containing protein [Niallia sp. 03133]|uniref:substrate-binding domain-containing protein n=1 Tax=Niallia sp. 03133 TaxID=3458060 RepID=UPI004044AB8F